MTLATLQTFAMQTPIPNLQQAFELQDQIQAYKEQIKLIERDLEKVVAARDQIINQYKEHGIEREGPFFIEIEREGRRTVDLKLLAKRFPWAYEKCRKIKETCSLEDLSKELGGADMELVVKKSAPTLRVSWDPRGQA